jgi:hypothetical protein
VSAMTFSDSQSADSDSTSVPIGSRLPGLLRFRAAVIAVLVVNRMVHHRSKKAVSFITLCSDVKSDSG